MSAVVGIDLGTTNTVVGVVQGGRAITIANERNERLLPSVVSFHPNGSILVGRDAKERRLVDAKNTIYSTKRLIGRSFDSQAVQKARARAAFEIREGPGQGPLVVARGETYTLPEISAFILREAKRIAEASLGETVDRAVITVPANFNDLQRAATKVAGRIAGVEVIRILNEPTAAALAYGYGKGNAERIAIYDFGGGTFDVTLLDLAGNVFEVLATAGDTFLGGDDIDIAIADHISQQFLTTHRYDPKADAQVFEIMLAAAERLKMTVASANAPSTHVFHDVVFGPGGKSLELAYTLTPAELSRICEPFVTRTLATCSDALKVAKLQPGAFEQIILVGGSTRLPIVREKVAAFFGRKPLDRLNPDEVVALGAAIQASALTGADRKRAPGPQVSTAPGLGPSPTSTVPTTKVSGATLRNMAPPPAEAAPRVRMPSSPEPVTSIPEVKIEIGSPDEAPTRLRSAGELYQGPNPFADFEETKAPPPPAPPRTGPGGTLVTGQKAAELAAAVAAATAAASTGTQKMPVSPAAMTPPVPAVLPGVAPAPLGRLPGVPPVAPPPIPAGPPPVKVAVMQAPARKPATPLLIDVTPLSLSVETVGGWTDVVIERNTPVPCERTRLFATASDDQPIVRVNVSQGESNRFRDNVFLGHLELAGLRRAPRGEVKISVTFGLDSDGILGVRAVDQSTGKETSAKIKLGGAVPEASEIAAMAERVQRRMS